MENVRIGQFCLAAISHATANKISINWKLINCLVGEALTCKQPYEPFKFLSTE